MSGWAERAAVTILPLSAGRTLAAALKEWLYTGRFFDLETADGTCELCGQRDLKYHFEIENAGTAASLLIGSECIKRFEIAGIDEQGTRLDAADTGRLVDRHRRGLVEDARKQRVMTALVKLGQLNDAVDPHSFIDYVDDRGAFTPKQLAMLFWKLDSAGVEYRKGDWKLTIRRDREKDQLRTMTSAAYARIYPSMTAAQRESIARIEARFATHGQSWRKL